MCTHMCICLCACSCTWACIRCVTMGVYACMCIHAHKKFKCHIVKKSRMDHELITSCITSSCRSWPRCIQSSVTPAVTLLAHPQPTTSLHHSPWPHYNPISTPTTPPRTLHPSLQLHTCIFYHLCVPLVDLFLSHILIHNQPNTK